MYSIYIPRLRLGFCVHNPLGIGFHVLPLLGVRLPGLFSIMYPSWGFPLSTPPWGLRIIFTSLGDWVSKYMYIPLSEVMFLCIYIPLMEISINVPLLEVTSPSIYPALGLGIHVRFPRRLGLHVHTALGCMPLLGVRYPCVYVPFLGVWCTNT